MANMKGGENIMDKNSKVEKIVQAINIIKKGNLTVEQMQEIKKQAKLTKDESVFMFFKLGMK